jgi:hypothetical protein
VRAPVFGEVGFATGRDLNSCDPSSGVLSSGVESTTRIESFVELPVVDFDNIWHNDQLKKSRESIGTKVTPEGLHDPNKLGHFQERRWRKLMDLHRKSIQNLEENWITGESEDHVWFEDRWMVASLCDE